MSEMGNDWEDPITVTPEINYGLSDGESSFDWGGLISDIGKTFATTYGAVNGPSSGVSYAPPPTSSYGATNPSATTAPASGMSSLFTAPNVYYLMGGAALLLVMLSKKGNQS